MGAQIRDRPVELSASATAVAGPGANAARPARTAVSLAEGAFLAKKLRTALSGA
jgi:hypothetical protein